MAAHIFHGPPGSFKSASAVWFRVLDALRTGRVVVTNIEGMHTKESIEIELDETFPESADIWRLSSQTEKGLYLWRRWFWWMPVKAFIIMDEVQDVFPSDSTVFKPIEFDVPKGQSGIELVKDKLPAKFYNHYKTEIADFSPDIDEDLKDDTGDIVLDENNHIIYPRTMREANMRHRKYNWDIIYCTPEISEIHKLVRSVCEFAYCHKYLEQLEFIPYFKRRVRIHEHSPKSSGYPKKKDDPTKWRKIPVQVHKLYRSTSTGKVSSNGGGVNALKSPSLIIALTLLLVCFSYAGWWLFIKPDRQDHFQAQQESTQQASENSRAGNTQTNRPDYPDDTRQSPNEIRLSLALPYDAEKIYLTGYQDVYLDKQKHYKQYFFVMTVGDSQVSINDHDLKSFGYKVSFINQCMVRLKKGEAFELVTCPPRTIETPVIEENTTI